MSKPLVIPIATVVLAGTLASVAWAAPLPKAKAKSSAKTAEPAACVAVDAPWRKIRWSPTMAAAQERARRENKPVLLLSLYGKLDEEFC